MYISQVNRHGGDVFGKEIDLDFSSNINPEGMPTPVKEAIINAAENCAAYPDPYCRRLREGISALEGVPCGQILCGSGAAELIYAFAFSLPEDRPVLIVSPTFCEYQAAAEAAGITCELYALPEETGFRLTGDILLNDLDRYGAVFLCTPNNPTGVTVEPDILRAIADTGVRVLADMCFLDLTDDPDKYDIPGLIEKYPNITVLKAFTKSYAMAGVRLGFAMCSDEDFLLTMSKKTQCWNVSSIAQQAGEAALNCCAWLKSSVRQISAERDRLTRELSSFGITVYPSKANYLLLYCEADLYELLLQRRILTRDCSDYEGLSRGYVRIAVRTRAENDILLSAIKEVIE